MCSVCCYRRIVKARRSGFTLTEVIVVLGLVVTLVALLLTGLKSVQSAHRQSTCMYNLRQIGQMIYTYSSENDGIIHPGNNNRSTWSRLLAERYLNVPLHSKDMKLLQVFYCPESRALGNDGDSSPVAHYWTNYAINSRVMGSGVNPRPLRRMLEFETPSRVGIMWDACTLASGPPNRAVGASAAYHIQAGNANQTVGFIHGSKDKLKRRGGKAGTLFLDGHVALLPDPGDGKFLDIQRTGNDLW